MRGSVHRARSKARELLKLYSLWQETRNEAIQKKFLNVLGEVLSREPHFNLRRVFQEAF